MVGNGGDHTACGESLEGGFASREHGLDADLCPRCFTPEELDTGRMRRFTSDLQSDAELPYFDEMDETTDLDAVPVDPERK